MRLFSVDPVGFFVGGERVKVAKTTTRNIVCVKFAGRTSKAAVAKNNDEDSVAVAEKAGIHGVEFLGFAEEIVGDVEQNVVRGDGDFVVFVCFCVSILNVAL